MKSTKGIKNLVVTILCSICCVCAVGLTVGSNNNSFAFAEVLEHSHDYDGGSYAYDFDEHWKKCETCDAEEVENKVSHTFVENACVCGARQSTINFNSDGGSSVPAITDTVGDIVNTPTAPQKEGHSFDGWYLDGNESAYEFSVMPQEDITLIAKWSKEVYTIKYNLNYTTTESAPNDDSISYGDQITTSMLPAPERLGYSFLGWFIPSGEQIGVDIEQMPDIGSSSITLYAKWQVNSYALSITYYKVNTETQIQPQYNAMVAFSSPYSVESPTINGYHPDMQTVSGSMDDVNGKAIIVYYSPNDDTPYTLYSYLEKVDGTFEEVPQIDTYYGVTDTTVEVPLNSRYNGFILDDDNAQNVLSGNLASDGSLVLVGYYLRKEFTITFNTMGADSIDSITKRMGESVSAPADPIKTGYKFGGWYEDEDCLEGNEYTFDKIEGRNVIVYAKWIANTYTVVFDKNNDGATGNTPSMERAYDDGKALYPSEFIKRGYYVTGWALTPDGEVVYNNSEIANLTEEDGVTVTLYAVWDAKSVAIYSGKTSAMQTLEVDSQTKYDQKIIINWAIGDEVGYTYTFSGVTIYAGRDKSGTVLAQFTSGVSGEYTMDGVYYDSIYVDAVASRTPNRYKVTFMFHDGDVNYTRELWAVYGEAYTIMYTSETGDETVRLNSLPYYTYVGHTFKGWMSEYVEPDGVISPEVKQLSNNTLFVNTQTTDVTLGNTSWHVYWAINTYEVTVDYRNSGTGQMLLVPYTEKVKYNTVYTIEHPTIWGYATTEPAVTGLMGTSDVRYKVYFDLLNYDYTFVYNDGVTSNLCGVYNIENALAFPSVSRLGYKFMGWNAECDNGNWSADELYNLVDTKHKYSGDVTFRAVWEIESPVITAQPEGYRSVYDGVVYELTVTAEHQLSETYDFRYQWYKDGELVKGATNKVLPISDVSDNGKYVCEITISDGKLSKTVTTSSAVVEIRKATYDMSGVWFPSKTFIVTGEEFSLSVAGILPEGVTVEYVGNGQKRSGVYEVIANFKGDDNHNEISSMTATLTLRASAHTASRPTDEKPRVIITEKGGMNPNYDPFIKMYNSGVEIPEEFLNRGEHIEIIYNISLLDGETEVQPENELTIKFLIPEDLRGEDFRILHKHGDTFVELEYTIDSEDGDYVVVKTNQLSEFIFLYKQTDLMWLIILLGCIFVAEIIIIAVLSSKLGNNKKNVKLKSVAPFSLLALFIFPINGTTIAIILGSLVLVGGIVIEIIASRLRKK